MNSAPWQTEGERKRSGYAVLVEKVGHFLGKCPAFFQLVKFLSFEENAKQVKSVQKK
jgi:hypothetical protein